MTSIRESGELNSPALARDTEEMRTSPLAKLIEEYAP